MTKPSAPTTASSRRTPPVARGRDREKPPAARLFGDRGADVPMAHVTRRAEVGTGAPYARRPTREAIFPEKPADPRADGPEGAAKR